MTDGIKVLWWSDTYWPQIGGIEVLASHLVPGLAARGFQITVVTNSSDGQPMAGTHDGVPIRRFPFHAALRDRGSDMRTSVMTEISELKRELKPDIVHVNFPSPSGLFHLLTAKAIDAQTICSIHTAFPPHSQSGDTLTRRMLVASDHVTANSRAMLRSALEVAPGIEGRSSVIYNGVPALSHDPSELPFEPPVIACIARLIGKKGIDVALRAFAIVRESDPRVLMIIAGDGPDRQQLEEIASDLGVIDHVDFRGWVQPSDIRHVLDSATLVVVPSRTTEPFGIVAVEAMQMGRPVVCTDQGGLPEVVEHGQTGLVVPAENSAAMANAILRILGGRALASRMGTAGITRARDCFSMERCITEHEALFRRMTDRR